LAVIEDPVVIMDSMTDNEASNATTRKRAEDVKRWGKRPIARMQAATVIN
jgi:hypothetical protein